MAIANVARGGTATNTTSTATSLAITVTAAAGDFIFVTVSTLAASATTAVTDNIGNKYYLLNDQIGASGRISCWFCPKSSGTVATVTATHAASRASGSVSTYTGVLGVGHCQKTTNAANNNTITMSPAIGAGNAMLAGMGDAVGTQTWTAVTGTLRNNIAGGGSTTPGSTNMDTLVSGGSTLAASLSVSVSGEAIAIELFSAVLQLATEPSITDSLEEPPFMWMLSPLQFLQGEDEPYNWGLNTNNLGAGGTQMMGFRGFVIYPAAMTNDYLQRGQQTIVVTTIREAFDQDEGLNIDWRFTEDGTSELEAITEDFIHEMVSVDLLYISPLQQSYHFAEDDQIGFQTQVVIIITGFDQDEGIPSLDSQQQWTDDDSTQSTFFAREQYSDADEQPSVRMWSWLQWTDDDKVDATFFTKEQFADIIEDASVKAWFQFQDTDDSTYEPAIWQNPLDENNYDFITRQLTISPEDEREMFEWGLNVQQPTTRNEEQFENIPQQQTFFFTEPSVDEDQPFSSVIVVVTNLPWDSENTFPANQKLIYADDEQSLRGSPFISPFPSDDSLDQYTSGWVQWQGTDEDKTDATFFTQEQFADVVEDPSVKAWLQFQDIEDSSYEPAIWQNSLDEDNWENFTKAWTQYQEDDIFGFNFIAPTNRPLPEDAEFNPAQQQSFYFNQEDLEKYNWGWMPPVLATARDETLIENQHPMQSYFIEELESDLDSSQSTFFALEQFGEGLEIQISQINFYFTKLEDDSFGFRPQIFIATDASLDQVIVQKVIVDDVEPFSFNPSLPTMDYTLPDEIIGQTNVIGYAIHESVAETLVQSPQEGVFDPVIITINIQDEEPVIKPPTQPFSFGDEIDHLPNPPYPVTHQTEFDQEGFNAPFITSMPFAWEEYGIPPNPPWPILDVTDYSDWIQNFTRIITIFGTGSVKIVSFSGFVKTEGGSGSVQKDSGSGSKGGVSGSGKVDIITGE